MTHDEMIAVIQAHKAGKKIQAQNIAGAWRDVEPPQFDFGTTPYRIKPVVREWWYYDCPNHKTVMEVGLIGQEVAEMGKCPDCREVVRVREVLE